MINKTMKSQSGLTLISILLTLALIAFFTLAILRLYPIYLDNFKVKSHLKSVAAEPEARTLTAADIKSTLIKRFDIDNVTSVPPEAIKISSDTKKKTIEVNYEVRTHFVANIDIVVVFKNNRIEVPEQ